MSKAKSNPKHKLLRALAVIDNKWPAAPPFYFFINKWKTQAFQYELGPMSTKGRE